MQTLRLIRCERLLQERLERIENDRRDAVFGGDTKHVPAGQATCSKLLHDCYRLVDVTQRSAEDVLVLGLEQWKCASYKAMRECEEAHEE